MQLSEEPISKQSIWFTVVSAQLEYEHPVEYSFVDHPRRKHLEACLFILLLTRWTFQHEQFAKFKCFAFRYFRTEAVEKTVPEKFYVQLEKWFEEEKNARKDEKEKYANERKSWADTYDMCVEELLLTNTE